MLLHTYIHKSLVSKLNIGCRLDTDLDQGIIKWNFLPLWAEPYSATPGVFTWHFLIVTVLHDIRLSGGLWFPTAVVHYML